MFICLCVTHDHGLGKILFNIILYLRQGLESGLLPSGFTTKTPHVYLFRHTHPTPRPSRYSLFGHLNNIWRMQIIKLIIM
jgi:hypothetical protein